MSFIGLVISLIIFFVFFAFYFPLVTIEGCSMYPTYISGQKIRARRITRFDRLEIGGVYVFDPPYEKNNNYVVKRLVNVVIYNQHEYCYFLGDNSDESYDSRNYGVVSREKIVAKLL